MQAPGCLELHQDAEKLGSEMAIAGQKNEILANDRTDAESMDR
jgi:hypothetical protein